MDKKSPGVSRTLIKIAGELFLSLEELFTGFVLNYV
jgi:hypothetical protein